MPCTEGHLVYYELSADTYIVKDNNVHGGEDHLYIGNSGWAGPSRTLIDFDISNFNTELTGTLKYWLEIRDGIVLWSLIFDFETFVVVVSTVAIALLKNLGFLES